MSLLDTDKLEEISDIKTAIWNIKPTALYDIPIYSSLPKIDNSMYKGQIIHCNDDIFVLSNESWEKIGNNIII